MRPRLLDLFCCAGCIARGYHRAGWDVEGVDIAPRPRYPYTFHQGDAIEIGARLLATGRFHAVHASPPCQAHSDLQKQSKRFYRDFIPQTRELLEASGLPYAIENVEGAPLRDPIVLCGAMFPETRVYRHRLFESNIDLAAPPHPTHAELTYTRDKRKAHYGRPLDLATMRVQVTGGGNAPVWAKAQAMGLADAGLTGRELNEGVPPAYGEFIGRQLLAHIEAERAA